MNCKQVLRTYFVVVVWVTSANATLVEWPIADGGNAHLYEAVSVPEGITWPEADAAAVAAGGYLVTITSEEENNFVYSLVDDDIYWHYRLDTGYLEGPWIGGYQEPDAPEPHGGWRWVTGEAFAYTNWEGGQPNNKYDDENAIHFGYQKMRVPTWNDTRNDQELNGYIVEIPEPATLFMFAFGGWALLRKRRKL